MSVLSRANSDQLEPCYGKDSEAPLELSGRECRDGLLMSAVRIGWGEAVPGLLVLCGQYLEYIASFFHVTPRG